MIPFEFWEESKSGPRATLVIEIDEVLPTYMLTIFLNTNSLIYKAAKVLLFVHSPKVRDNDCGQMNSTSSSESFSEDAVHRT